MAALVEAVDLIDQSNRRTEETFGERRVSVDSVVSTLDTRTEDLEQRLKRFSALLDETLDGASGRARDIARLIANPASKACSRWSSSRAHQRDDANDRRKARQRDAGHVLEARQRDEEIFSSTQTRFTDMLQGMRQMAAEMQRELETTRTELRRGILELPQETAESAAQMRRVIVDQIEALAELNRIVARHGRGLDAAEPARREPAIAAASAPRGSPALRRAAAHGSAEDGAAARQMRRLRPLPRVPTSPAPRRCRAARPNPRRSAPRRAGQWKR